jgi:GT2 family glycosyltransferase
MKYQELVEKHREKLSEIKSLFSNIRINLDKRISVKKVSIEGEAKVSIIIPLHKTPLQILDRLAESINNQSYRNIEVVMIDDGSKSEELKNKLKKYRDNYGWKILFNENNIGISESTNRGIYYSTGCILAFIDHDDTIEKDAIEKCVNHLEKNNLDVIYTDQDTVEESGIVNFIFRKPDWSPEYLKHVMYVGHLLVIKKSIAIESGLFNKDYDGVQDYEFMLRVSEKTNKVGHIPEVLYHWHAVEGSIAKKHDAKDNMMNISELQVMALQEYLQRNKIPGKAIQHGKYNHRCLVETNIPKTPKVSIVIPNKNSSEILNNCLNSIFLKTTYINFEVIVVDTGSEDESINNIYSNYNILKYDFAKNKFNFSDACNYGAAKSNGEIIIFLNNDIEIISSNWIEELVYTLQTKNAGVAGAMLIYTDNTIQHAGVVLGARGTADHVARGFPSECDGYAGSLSVPHEVSAITGACLAIKKSTFNRIGMFSNLYHTHYQDVDLCLKVLTSGETCIINPSVKLIHHESKSRGTFYDIIDRMLFINSWYDLLEKGDRYYSKYHCLNKLDYSEV